ncbi:DNA/RNA non-specific endonuclease [Hoylesella shahii]|uniref:DNA/RNA non-specific endonuclease n=2 Tax=Hoylesella shahii TaxID=228603 RepID=UPI0028E35E21|nr:DNA/RNA non-specific endonuclease [Hoylesella shahii]
MEASGRTYRGDNVHKVLSFKEDKEMPKPRADDRDYINSGYHHVHLCSSADNCWDATAQKQSFLFTKICSQDHKLNPKPPWALFI